MSEEIRKRLDHLKLKLRRKHTEGMQDSPYQAANKALSELIRKRKKMETVEKINFTLIESTKGSKHKQHEYVEKRWY